MEYQEEHRLFSSQTRHFLKLCHLEEYCNKEEITCTIPFSLNEDWQEASQFVGCLSSGAVVEVRVSNSNSVCLKL